MNNGFELKKIFGKGEGVFATKPFHPHETVMVGTIEKILNANHSHASQTGKHKYVLHAGLVSKVNHSCNPNCGIRVNEAGAHDFIAIKNISINEELTFDYAMRNYSVDHFPEKCGCGAQQCRGQITGWKNLPDKKKKEYKGFVAPYLVALDAKNSKKI
ncbi:MAG: SET domain-containing protein [Candidatus Electrothrix sp. EH2]|nr:SET domain-containing protein [Candidatus Electrothrix sp. EH2]